MKVYVSSTYSDLKKYRDKVFEVLERLGTQADRMEAWGSLPKEPLDECLKKIEQCDLFVGIYAYKYGSIPPGENQSYNELENNYAKKLEKPRFCFCVDELKTPNWPEKYKEYDPVKQQKMSAFKTKLQNEMVVERFTTPLDLGMKVSTSIGQYLMKIKERTINTCYKTFGSCAVPIKTDLSKIFVLMPFADSFDLIYTQGIRKAFEELNEERNSQWSVSRADEDLTMPEALCKVCKNIQEAGIIVADLTNKNPNVFLELGLSFGCEKRFILLCQDHDLPFDIRTLNVIEYTPDNLGALRNKIKKNIEALSTK